MEQDKDLQEMLDLGLVDKAAEDPTEPEVSDPSDPSYVEPWTPEGDA